MNVTVVITNYNYIDFVTDCVNSVLSQTYKEIEIIVIDDGSTDGSLDLLREKYGFLSNLKIISKENGGQLSAFNEAVKYISGEIVCFLDADDLYKQNYIEEIVKIYKQNEEVNFIFSAIEKFYPNGKIEIIQKYPEDRPIGFSVISTLFAKEWIGSPTSAISMKTSLLKKVLPIPFENEWITRADDCLIWGSSILGAYKYYLSKPLVRYRIHYTNNYYGKIFSDEYLYQREISINRLFTHLINKSGISSQNLIDLINFEYRTRGDKSLNLLKLYLKILIKSNISFPLKFKKGLRLILDTIK